MFRSTIAPAKREANAATMISVQTVKDDGGGDERLHARLERANAGREQQEHGERDHADVEVELGEVPEEELEHVDDVVALLADDLVGAEQARDRRTSRELRAEHEHRAAGDDPVERHPRPQRPARDQPQKQGRGQRGEDHGETLHAHERDHAAGREQDELPPRASARPGRASSAHAASRNAG